MRKRMPEYEAYRYLGPCGYKFHHLYVIELSDGLVKVGRTHNPRQRMRTHHVQMGRVGLRIVRFAVYQTPNGEANERELLRRIYRLTPPIRGHRELFRGLSFGCASTLAKQISARLIVTA